MQQSLNITILSKNYHTFMFTWNSVGIGTYWNKSNIHTTKARVIQINWNNFYNVNNTNLVISSVSINLNANNNYWSNLDQYTQIAPKLENSNPCIHNQNLIELTSIIQHPINTSNPIENTQCLWDITNCTIITNYKCNIKSIH